MTYPRNIPISLPALLKRIPYPVKGYCATKIKPNEYKDADIIIIDVHWFFGLNGTKELVKKVRKINPEVIFIAGGISATEYPNQLIEKLDVDYVIRGDGEIPLPMLVTTLVDGGDLSKVPNLIGKNGLSNLFSVKPYSLSKADFDANDFYDIDFFPYMKKELQSLHARNPGFPTFIYPFLLPFRGCPINCDFCSGAPDEQKKIFGRRVVVRSPERLGDDIRQLEKQDWIQFANCLLDFVTLLPDKYAETVLPNPTRLKIQYEFTKPPNPDQLKFFLSRFKGGIIHFSMDDMHLTSENYTEPDYMAKLIKITQQHPEYLPVLDYSSIFAATNVQYRNAVYEVIKKSNCYIYDGSIWWSDFPMPGEGGYADEEKFDYFLKDAISFKHNVLGFISDANNFMELVVPKPMMRSIRKRYYTLFHNLPFLIKASSLYRSGKKVPETV